MSDFTQRFVFVIIGSVAAGYSSGLALGIATFFLFVALIPNK